MLKATPGKLSFGETKNDEIIIFRNEENIAGGAGGDPFKLLRKELTNRDKKKKEKEGGRVYV